MRKWTSLDTDQAVRYYSGARSGRDHANEERIGLQNYDDDKTWRNVMLWCLKYQKKRALMLLLATFKCRKYRPPRYVVSDSLTFLARHFLFKVADPNPTAVDVIWLLTCNFIDGASDQDYNLPVSQHLIYLVLQHSDDSRVLSFYWLLSLNKAVLHANTMLHFLERFLDMGKINLAMKLLGTITSTGYDLSKDQVQMACVRLLRARFDTQAEYTVRSNILTQILEMRVRPKIQMFNAILLNAAEGGDFANAWQMYGLAKENALTPNSITYGVLLKGAILSNDVSKIALVIREVQVNDEVLQDNRLVSDMLHAICLASPGDEFRAMFDFYKQHCDLGPLRELSLCGDETQAPPGAKCSVAWPTSYILTQMIVAYVRLHQRSTDLIHNYNLYYQHVKENHPLIAPLARESFVSNAFLKAFGTKPHTLQHCITVIKHMLEVSSPSFAPFQGVAYAAPTEQTWTILAGAYFYNHQRNAGEKIINMMRERGIRGDAVTWNMLISSYAHLQDAKAAVDTVKRMEAAGFDRDSYTSNALGKVRTRYHLAKALEACIKEQPINAGPLSSGRLAPLDSEEEQEARMTMEWESNFLTRGKEVKEYMESKS